MVGAKAFWSLLGVTLVAVHVGSALGLSQLTYWVYFGAGSKWTPDPVVPQIQAALLLVGQTAAALIFVPVGILAHEHSRAGLPIAIGWPLAYAVLPFLLPNIVVWLVAAISLFFVGLALVRKKAEQANP